MIDARANLTVIGGCMVVKMFDKIYLAGISKTTKLHTIWEGRRVIFSGSFEDMKKELIHLRKLADKREARNMIADICGTSYKAAMEDMGGRF